MMNQPRFLNPRGALGLLLAVLAAALLGSYPAARAADDGITEYVNIPAGSYIVDMGVTPQTIASGLKPYGLVYDLVRNQKVPVDWVINPAKAKDGIDFSYAGKDYRGGPFIVRADFATPTVVATINAWRAQGVTVDGPIGAGIPGVPVYETLTALARQALDLQNGSIAASYLANAGIPASAYSLKSPNDIDECDDTFSMPHADPTWLTHSNLARYVQLGGYLWAACHAVSVLENVDDPADPDLNPNLNFLSVNGLVPYGSHGAGTPPYSYNPLSAADPVMQFLGVIDSATQNGSEQIYLPKTAGWRATTGVYISDPDHPNVPGSSPGPAAALAVGRAYGNNAYGRVMYEGGHNHTRGLLPDSVAAQRAFLNFYLLTGIDRRAVILPGVPSIIAEQSSTNFTAAISGGSGFYSYQWSSSIGGAFSNPNGVTTSYAAPDVASNTVAIIRLTVTDSCGRVTFAAVPLTVQTAPSADLSVTKSTTPASVTASSAFAYNLAVINAGSDTATNVVVTDQLPPQVAFVSASGSGWAITQTNGLVTATRATLGTNAGSPSVITINVTAPTNNVTLTNIAAVSSIVADPNPANNTNTLLTPLLGGVDLRLGKTSPASAYEGIPFDYTITVTNFSAVTVSNVIVTDVFPTNLSYVSATGAGWSFYYTNASRTFTAVLPSLGSLATSSFTLRAAAAIGTAGGGVTNSASVINESLPDSDPSNNSASATTAVVPAADLFITKRATVNTTNQTFTFLITLANQGPSAATNIQVLDVLGPSNKVAILSSNLSAGAFAPNPPGGGNPGSAGGTWTIPSLGAGQTATLTLVYDYNNKNDTFSNAVTATSATYDPAPNNNTDSVIVDKDFTVVDLALTKTDSPDPVVVTSNLTYTITVRNTSSSTDWKANGVVTVNDDLPPGVTYQSASGGAGWTFSYNATSNRLTATFGNAINKNTSNSFTVTVTAPATPGVITNKAYMTAVNTGDKQMDTNPNNDFFFEPTTVIGQSTDVQVLSKTVDNPTPSFGSNLTYTVTIRNNGPFPATNIRINDALPAGLVYVSDTSSQGVYDPSLGSWFAGSLATNATATLNITATTAQMGAITNVASLNSLDQTDTNAGNNSASVVVNVVAADLALGKTVNNTMPNVGSNVTFTLVITNRGPDSASSIAVTDLLPAGLQYVSHIAGAGSYNSGSGVWAVGTLASNQTATLSLVAQVTAAGGLTNTATVTAASISDGNLTNNTASASLTGQLIDIAVGKTGDNLQPMTLGTNLVFTITATNFGPSAASGVQLSDALPAGLNYVSHTVSQGSYTPGSGVWNLGALSNGASASLQITVTNSLVGRLTNTAAFLAANQTETDGENSRSVVVLSGTQADLYLTKAVDNPAPLPGSQVVFTLNLNNDGPDASTGVIVRDVLPAGLTYLSHSPTNAAYTNATGIWNVGTLSNGQAVQLAITALVTGTGQIVNTAEIIAALSADPDPIGSSASAAIEVTPLADLAVFKTGPATVPAGSNLTYTITLTNLGPVASTNVVVTDTLPTNVTFVSASGGGVFASNRVTWPAIGTLTNTAVATFTVTVTAPASGSITNSASATPGTTDPDTSNNDGSAPASRVVTMVSPGYNLGGTVFEDVNYGGGAGRSLAAASGVGRSNARVELYDAAGSLIANTLTVTNGAYSFTGLSPTNYTVRVVNSSVSSSRAGYTTNVLAVQTYRTDASTGSVNPVTDRVGGEDPTKIDPGNGSTTLAALAGATNAVQSLTSVLLSTNSLTNLDFGFNFDTIVNTNNAGPGSLRQFLANAAALGNAGLAQVGQPAGKEVSIFMISDGAAHPGLRAGLPNQLTAGVAIIRPGTLLPAITGADTTVDGTTQTANVGDSNPGQLGTGGSVGVDGLPLPTVSRPEVQIIDGASVAAGLDLQANNITIRGIAIHGFGNNLASLSDGDILVRGTAGGAIIEHNVISAGATSFGDPGAAARSGTHSIAVVGGDNGIVRSNLVGFAAGTGFFATTGSDNWQVLANEIRGGGINNANQDAIGTLDIGAYTFRGNLLAGYEGTGIDMFQSSGANLIENNTITGNGIGTGASLEDMGIRLYGPGSVVDRNIISSNFGPGIAIVSSSSGNRITRNAIFGNGGALNKAGSGPSGQVGIDLLNPTDDGNVGTAPFYTVNDSGDSDTGGNGLLNYPVLTTAVISNGNLIVSGFVRPGNTIEFFLAAPDPTGFGEGQTYLFTGVEGGGSDTAAGTGTYGPGPVNGLSQGSDTANRFTFSVPLPGGVTPGSQLTATATDGANNTSEFSGGVPVAFAYGISGVVFEDVNYAGGAGRSLAAASGVGRPNARVELYDAAGNLLTNAVTTNSGLFSFSGLAPTNYTVRVVNSSVSSSRTGYTTNVVAVQTFRTDAGSGAVTPVTDRVGGEDPTKADPGNGSTTLAALASATNVVQSLTAVTLSTNAVTNIDFGFNFDTIVNTNNAGPGSLRQFLVNAAALAGADTSGFMISDGAAHPGLRAGLPNQLTAGVAVVRINSTLPDITDADTVIDGTTQSANVGNSNPGQLGTGGTVGVDAIPLAQVNAPEVQIIPGTTKPDVGLILNANNTVIRGIAMFGFGNAQFNSGHQTIRVAGGTGQLFEQNIFGTTATSFTDPRLAGGSASIGNLIDVQGGAGTVRSNLFGFAGCAGLGLNAAVPAWTVAHNEFNGNSVDWNFCEAIVSFNAGNKVGTNLFANSRGAGVDAYDATAANEFVNNSFLNNGLAGGGGETAGLEISGAGASVQRNVFSGNAGAGVLVRTNATGITISRNSITGNGTVGGIGIDLLEPGDNQAHGTAPYVTTNAPGPRVGGNNLRNFPVLTSAYPSGGNTIIVGTLNSTPNTTFTNEFFVNVTAHPSGHGEGATFLNAITVTTDGSGNASFTNIIAGALPVGRSISATATDPGGNTSEFSGVVPVTDVADIAVFKSGATNGIAGSNQTFTITVTNSGPAAATNVVVSDQLPAGFVFVSASPAAAGVTNNLVSWPSFSLVSGSASNFTVTALPTNGGSFTNVAFATAGTPDPNTNNNNGTAASSQAATLVTNLADVAVFKAGPTNGIAGSNLVFTLTVTNSGPSAATNVVVSDRFPAGFAFVSAAPAATVASNTASWPVLSLASGAATNYSITLLASNGGTFTNLALATSGTPDPDTNNNNGTAASGQVAITVSGLADLAVSKGGPTNVLAATNFSYTITLTNSGPSAAAGVIVSDTLPTNVVFVTASAGGSLSNGVVSWNLAGLASGAATNYTVIVTAPAGGAFTNRASAAAATSDPNAANNDGSAAASQVATTVTPLADVEVFKSAPGAVLPVTNFNYTILVTNAGPSAASNVVVADALPTNVVFVSASGGGSLSNGTVTWPAVASLAAGDTTNFTVTVTAPVAGSFTNTASSAAATIDPVPANNDGSAVASRAATVVTTVADVAIHKTGPASVLAGSNLTFTIIVTNTGPAAATNITASDLLPTNAVFVSASAGGVLSNGIVTWPTFSLPDGGSSNFTVTLTAPTEGSLTNIGYGETIPPDPNPGNNDGSGPDGRVVTAVTPVADIALGKSGPASVVAGTNFIYTIAVTNLGPSTASNMTVLDTLPTDLVFVSASAGGGFSNGTVVWPAISAFTNGATTNFTITVTAPGSGAFTNSAAASSDALDPVPGNNDGSAAGARVVTTVLPPGGVTVSGFVYNDANHNLQKDGGESGTGLSLYAKLLAVTNAAGPALQAALVTPGTGAYSLTNVPPGIYTIVIDDNNTLADVTPALPAGWSGTEMPAQTRTPVAVAGSDLPNQNFGLVNALGITGRVFKDNGASGGTANDGLINGAEAGLGGVTVKLTDATGATTYATATTDASGNYTLLVPATVPNGATLKVTEVNPGTLVSVSGAAGNTGGAYDRATDTVTFTYASGAAYSGVNFGDVDPSTFVTDGQAAGLPGTFVVFPHTFTAGSAGQVTFSAASAPSPALTGWTPVLYRDANCNGVLEPGEPVLSGAVSVAAGDKVCILVKEFIPVAAPFNAQDQLTVTAAFTYTGASPALNATLTRTDLATVGNPTTAGLTLLKSVDKPSALPGETITYTVTYQNNSSDVLSNVVIYDETPAFTVFSSAAHGPLPANLTAASITLPGVGSAGAVRWTFTGTLAPGASGTVSYSVTLTQ